MNIQEYVDEIRMYEDGLNMTMDEALLMVEAVWRVENYKKTHNATLINTFDEYSKTMMMIVKIGLDVLKDDPFNYEEAYCAMDEEIERVFNIKLGNEDDEANKKEDEKMDKWDGYKEFIKFRMSCLMDQENEEILNRAFEIFDDDDHVREVLCCCVEEAEKEAAEQKTKKAEG